LTAPTAQKSKILALVLALIFAGAGLLYLDFDRFKVTGVILILLCWTGIANIVGLYLTWVAAEEIGL
jgi:TM2 domain-containing membrane protein YozV